MTLTVAEIERWDPEAIREVFHAATARGNIAVGASTGLAALPVFQTWGGEAAESAKESIGQTRRDLDAHGQEAFAVASAANAAADGVERVRSDLSKLKVDAHSLGMEIDPATNAVVPAPGSRMAPQEVLLKEMQLQPRLDTIIADANLVDANLARAIDMADGSVPIPGNPVSTTADSRRAGRPAVHTMGRPATGRSQQGHRLLGGRHHQTVGYQRAASGATLLSLGTAVCAPRPADRPVVRGTDRRGNDPSNRRRRHP